ncbi:hypothetical protein E4Z66_02455 [Aliishimia ponticola]|uniref:Uncharacterized protein n=1 Tax=Aliishimia ponticola TaxID=2499833 RepID=A0A4S4NFS0_9RHOB|nr:hypothetical protein [Aliishimia ponticola]THH38452.1 hypothetical protein E4Z66_02455 [Aliishimia ponticola]
MLAKSVKTGAGAGCCGAGLSLDCALFSIGWFDIVSNLLTQEHSGNNPVHYQKRKFDGEGADMVETRISCRFCKNVTINVPDLNFSVTANVDAGLLV